MIGELPLDAGALKLTVACVSPADAVTLRGAPGAIAVSAGVTAFDGTEGDPVPTELAAVTVKV